MSTTHIFDVDHTLLRASTGACFIREGLRRKVLRLYPVIQIPFHVMRYRQARLDDKILEGEIKLLRNLSRDTLFDIGRESFRRYAKKYIYNQVVELISLLQSENAEIIFASSSFDFLVIPVAEFFGVRHIVCSVMEYKDGICTGRIEGKPAFGINKKEKTIDFLKSNKIACRDCTFYSDSIYDLPLFDAVKHQVAINPDKKLRKHALKNNWKILFYKNN
ncbi:MAG: HAD-IB family hydrolase [Spirochaetales bacterium]|nr:HAD-IB family hydrolase [Spirochaetales bacterium]